MGGPGSGSQYQWWRGRKKTTVEECEDLDANRWMREGILKAGVCRVGSWRWVYHSGRENSITYEANTLDHAYPFVRLSYNLIRSGAQEKEPFDYRVKLTTTRPRVGGLRWWFVCPLVVNGRACSRRVGKLYLPPRGLYFGCRHCHELTYKSTQTHDKRVDALRRNPALLDAILANPEGNFSEVLLALKAIR
ncbi:MAG TPA: hypothetical protein VEL76_32220 [Gemmataceae bacterium]|nr:hypothetical protein [Gemmataceae bacterium]